MLILWVLILQMSEEFWEKGARYVSLTHNGHNQFSDSNTGEFDGTTLHNGLSDLERSN